MGKKKGGAKNNKSGPQTPSPPPEEAPKTVSPPPPAPPHVAEVPAQAEVSEPVVSPEPPKPVESPKPVEPAKTAEPAVTTAASSPASPESENVQVLNDFALHVAAHSDTPPNEEDLLDEPQVSTTSVGPVPDEPSRPTETGCMETNCSGCHVM